MEPDPEPEPVELVRIPKRLYFSAFNMACCCCMELRSPQEVVVCPAFRVML